MNKEEDVIVALNSMMTWNRGWAVSDIGLA
jgi:hypothetical protein